MADNKKTLMAINLIVTGFLLGMLLFILLMPFYQLLKLYVFPPRKITIKSKKSGKTASLDLKKTDDEVTILEFATIFYGRE